MAKAKAAKAKKVVPQSIDSRVWQGGGVVDILRAGQKLFIGHPDTGEPVELSDHVKILVINALTEWLAER